MTEEILMALGALVWLCGELIAVRKGQDTTSSYVWRGERLKTWGPWVRLAAVVGCTWLLGHLAFGLWG